MQNTSPKGNSVRDQVLESLAAWELSAASAPARMICNRHDPEFNRARARIDRLNRDARLKAKP